MLISFRAIQIIRDTRRVLFEYTHVTFGDIVPYNPLAPLPLCDLTFVICSKVFHKQANIQKIAQIFFKQMSRDTLANSLPPPM